LAYRDFFAKLILRTCFVEQARLDGALCSFTETDKMNFLKRAHNDYNIRNMEMEAACCIALCKRANVKCKLCCRGIRHDHYDQTKEH